MTDIENLVINTISERVTAAFPEADVTGIYTDTPQTFPHVCVQQADKETYTRSLDGELQPHHETVFFSVDVFSAAGGERKSEAKAIMDLIDEVMAEMLFTLTSQSPTPNIDRTVYRITSRYRAVHGRGRTVGDDTVVQMYRD